MPLGIGLNVLVPCNSEPPEMERPSVRFKDNKIFYLHDTNCSWVLLMLVSWSDLFIRESKHNISLQPKVRNHFVSSIYFYGK